MVNLRHKRSKAKLISLPSLEGSSTPFGESSPIPAVPRRSSAGKSTSATRWSNESLTPSDGYSGLFTSGILRQQPEISPTLSSFPSPPSTVVSHKTQPSSSSTKPTLSTSESPNRLSPPKTISQRSPSTPRKRSSIIHQTPSSVSPRVIKSRGVDNGVEQALEGVMRSLKLYATVGTPKASTPLDDGDSIPEIPDESKGKMRWSARSQKFESRWSSSSDDTIETGETDGSSFWRSRKSSESARSKATTKSIKSVAGGSSKAKSVKSVLRGRKSEESVRSLAHPVCLVEEEDVPPVPAPVTPGRSRRMIEGIAKRLGLTPRKIKAVATPPVPSTSNASIMSYDPKKQVTRNVSSTNILMETKKQPGSPMGLPGLPPPPPPDRAPPRKSSLSNLRSVLTKKGSSTTLRSMRSIITVNSTATTYPSSFEIGATPPMPTSHPFMNPIHTASVLTLDCQTPSPVVSKARKEDSYGFMDDTRVEGCLPPMTPRRRSGSEGGRRTPKSSIGLPRLMPSTSPSAFLREMPRKAPHTPKRDEVPLPEQPALPSGFIGEGEVMDIEMELASGIEREVLAEIRESMGLQSSEDIAMEEEKSLQVNLSKLSADESYPSFGDVYPSTPGLIDDSMDSIDDQSLAYGIYTPEERSRTISNTHYSFHLESTPPLQSGIEIGSSVNAEVSFDEDLASSTPVLTAKALRATQKPKPSRVLDLLPNGTKQKQRHLGSIHTPLQIPIPNRSLPTPPPSAPHQSHAAFLQQSAQSDTKTQMKSLTKEKKSFENLRQVFRSPKKRPIVGLPTPSPSPYTSLVDAHRNNFGGKGEETPSKPAKTRIPLGVLSNASSNIPDIHLSISRKIDERSKVAQWPSSGTRGGMRGVEYFDRFTSQSQSENGVEGTFGRSFAPLNIKKTRIPSPPRDDEVGYDDWRGEVTSTSKSEIKMAGVEDMVRSGSAGRGDGSIASKEDWELETYLKESEGSQGSCE